MRQAHISPEGNNSVMYFLSAWAIKEDGALRIRRPLTPMTEDFLKRRAQIVGGHGS